MNNNETRQAVADSIVLIKAFQEKQEQLLKVQAAVRDFEIKTKASATENAKKLKR